VPTFYIGGIIMYAYCFKCNIYDSGDTDDLDSLVELVKEHGGLLSFDDDRDSVCPRCGENNCLRID